MNVPPMIYVLLICLALKIGLMVCLCGCDLFTSSKVKKIKETKDIWASMENAMNDVRENNAESLDNQLNELQDAKT